MGTNYYLVKAEKRCEHCGSVSNGPEKIHIGKSSVGWHFGFESTIYKTLDEWKAGIDKWIAEGGWIADEYDDEQKVTPEQFWEMVRAKRNAPECQGRYTSFAGGTSACFDGVDFSPWSFS